MKRKYPQTMWFAVALLVLVLLPFGQVRGVLGADYHGPLRKEKSSCYIGGYESVTEAVSREDSCAAELVPPVLPYGTLCRLGVYIEGPDGLTIPQFVTKGFNDELKFADLYDESAGVSSPW